MRRQKSSPAETKANPDTLLRQPAVLQMFPVSATTWWQGIRAGKYPKPHRIGPRMRAWRLGDILQLIEQTKPREDKSQVNSDAI